MIGLYPSKPTLGVRIRLNPCQTATDWEIRDFLRNGDKRTESLDMLLAPERATLPEVDSGVKLTLKLVFFPL